MRTKMTDRDYYRINQTKDLSEARSLAGEYYREGHELERTVESLQAEITHLQQRLAKAHEMLGV